MRIISVANQKGGVGKTTTVINVAAELARKKRTLIIDLDPQGNTSKALSCGVGEFDFELSSAYLFDKPKIANIKDTIRPALAGEKEIENLYLIPADIQLSRVIETSLTKINRERILSRHLAEINTLFDFVILDTPPNLSLTTLNAIQCSDLVLIPVDSGAFSIDGVSPLLDALDEIKEGDSNYKIFRNEVDSRNGLINGFLDAELKHVAENVLSSSVRRSEHISQANALSNPVRFYKSGSTVVNDYKRLTQEIINVLHR
ncbi:ParA family protein [Aliivibrio sp. S3MY1]|uniref:ParA family protein n=1 Tax=Aliivibrio sp. S3MY1 TaxID=3028424 RepID=UPI0023785CB6|nr:ParA family protein [Aliivibrio sp. S3MY1]MDD9196846.1 ParA family protein [Aliivibrio sp. S3MY1]